MKSATAVPEDVLRGDAAPGKLEVGTGVVVLVLVVVSFNPMCELEAFAADVVSEVATGIGDVEASVAEAAGAVLFAVDVRSSVLNVSVLTSSTLLVGTALPSLPQAPSNPSQTKAIAL